MLSGSEPIVTLDQVALAASFPGFEPDDFELFEIAGFSARMPMLRERIKPKLTQLGQALLPRISELLGEPQFPHVAQHLRRTVNAPEETWVAFSRSPRAYKPFVHFRVAASADGMRILVFVEDYADEKTTFASALKRNASELSAFLEHHPTIHAYDMRGSTGEATKGHDLTPEALGQFADRMQRVKGQHARFGIPFAKTHPVLQSGPEFCDAVLDAVKSLRPLYDCGAIPQFQYTHTPEIIVGLG